jgi:hypothetical protein
MTKCKADARKTIELEAKRSQEARKMHMYNLSIQVNHKKMRSYIIMAFLYLTRAVVLKVQY